MNSPVSLPTDEMLDAAIDVAFLRSARISHEDAEAIYLAMEAARPKEQGVREAVEGVLKRNMAAMNAACEDGRGNWSAEVVAGKVCDAIAALSQSSSPVLVGGEAHGSQCENYTSACRQCLDDFRRWKDARAAISSMRRGS